MDNTEREKIIIDYISSHDGCSPESALKAINEKMARQTYYKCLSVLKERKIIREEYRNKRDKSLHINKNDITVVIANEFDNFEKTYFELLERTFIEVKKPVSKREKVILVRNLLFNTLLIFNDMMHTYSYKLSIKWPVSIPDRKHLERAQVITLDRISKLYGRLYKTLKKYKYDEIVNEYENINESFGLSKVERQNFDELISSRFKIDIYSDKKNWAAQYKVYNLEQYAYDALKSFSISDPNQ